ncbi:MAG: di-heme-cytochrome C peroxidase [Pseudomonadota bacterium]
MKRTGHALALSMIGVLAVQLSGPTEAEEVQGWSAADRAGWYRATQGSRMMPLSWFDALDSFDGQGRFADLDNLKLYGFLLPPKASSNRPIGFQIDRQADADFPISGLSWYDDQVHDAARAERWIGLNCAACHTGRVDYGGVTTVIDGAPAQLDFQRFTDDLVAAMQATRDDPVRWDVFAGRVLDGKDGAVNRAMLRGSYETLLAWMVQTEAMNQTSSRYGPGRLDAVGHILNKVLMFNGADASHGNPSDAPVSYPFLWDIWRQDRVQWNGVAQNSRFALPGDPFEYGALGRNTGEVLGVFGEVRVEPNPGRLEGFDSTVQIQNLMKLELILQDLKAPRWPDHFPPIDLEAAGRGADLFAENCASCHLTPDMQRADEGTERMVTFRETLGTDPRDLTDIWMACNAYLAAGPSGPMEGQATSDGTPMGAEGPVVEMLEIAVKGSLIGDKPALVGSAVRNFFGVDRAPVVFDEPGDPFESGDADPDARAREVCLTDESPLLAYKARPLDGIWATAPYLHNGSVASLYELLLPADERRTRFWTGHTAFDPVSVGYEVEKPLAGGFELILRRDDGTTPKGNDNRGHEYGAESFSHEDRMALVEYMKTL